MLEVLKQYGFLLFIAGFIFSYSFYHHKHAYKEETYKKSIDLDPDDHIC